MTIEIGEIYRHKSSGSYLKLKRHAGNSDVATFYVLDDNMKEHKIIAPWCKNWHSPNMIENTAICKLSNVEAVK